MKRVASLYLPHWSIDRVLRAERRHAPPPERQAPDLLALKTKGDAERGKQCDAPKNTGWRPGARWARVDHEVAARDVERRIAALPAHQRPPMREMGRRSAAADMPFKRLPGDDGGKSSGWVEPQEQNTKIALSAWNAVPAIRYPGDAPNPDKLMRRGSNDPHSAPPGIAVFFDTARTTADTIARVCPERFVERRPAGVVYGETPLVTVHKIGSRLEIAAASPGARAIGLDLCMALTQARASVPDLDVRDADPDGDHADLERLAIALARRWTPIVAISDADGLFLDLTGVAHLHGGEEAMMRRIVRLLARLGVTARIAVANTAGAAWALARFALPPPPRHPSEGWGLKPQGRAQQSGDPGLRRGDVIMANEEGRSLLTPLPVTALRLDEPAIDLLRRLGIDTIGDLLAIPRAPLVRRFGVAIARRLDQVTGAAPEPLDPIIPPQHIAITRRFAEPIATAHAIAHWLGDLVADLTVALAEAGQGARALLFAAERVDGSVQTIRIGLARPTRDAPHILRLIARRIEEVDPGYGIDALTLHVRRADPLGPETLGAHLAEEQTPDLTPLVDTLANRIGMARLWRHRPVESDVPERSVAPLPPLDPPERDTTRLRLDDVRRLDTRAPDHPWHPRWPRPIRLLRRPERIDHVLAELPDFPPLRFTWRGTTHRVIRGDGPERITGEWWKRSAERGAIRDYFRVEDDTGKRFWLFRRGDGQRAETGDLTWYMHGTFG